jgi:hypothetical protein
VIPPTWVYALEDLREARAQFLDSKRSLLLFLKLRAYPPKRKWQLKLGAKEVKEWWWPGVVP